MQNILNFFRKDEIVPKIIIEPLMRNNINESCEEIQVYCFYGKPKFLIRLQDKYVSLYDENLNIIDDILVADNIKINKGVDDLINQSFILSKKLSKDFNFVRVDWMVFEGRISDFSSLKLSSTINKVVQNVNNTFEHSDGFSVSSSLPPSQDLILRKIFFEELTFTPYSGFFKFDKNLNKKMGDWIKL